MLAAAGVLATVFHPQAQETSEGEPPAVSEADIQLYIKVYGAMQEDHDLTIENALRPHQISLDDFRQIERRIQNQPRLVERVRQALLDQVKANSTFAQSAATPTPGELPKPEKGGKTKKK
ncbi:MAG TPA: hypothetical protein VMW56_19150 [Candidatus Margulisiibacteriota bacterium]|nr:hypothetical protein [Candidatus Margulisiibacteriota bacterium]